MSDNLILPSWLSRGIEEYFPIKGTDQTFLEIIDHAKKNNKKLRVKLGIDPTGTDIHLGHSILFKKLRAFQDNGHIAVLIITLELYLTQRIPFLFFTSQIKTQLQDNKNLLN